MKEHRVGSFQIIEDDNGMVDSIIQLPEYKRVYPYRYDRNYDCMVLIDIKTLKFKTLQGMIYHETVDFY